MTIAMTPSLESLKRAASLPALFLLVFLSACASAPVREDNPETAVAPAQPRGSIAVADLPGEPAPADAAGAGGAVTATATTATERRELLTEAIIRGTNAFQGLLARSKGRGDETCFGTLGLSDEELIRFATHQKGLLATPPAAVNAWVEGSNDDAVFMAQEHLLPLAFRGPPGGEKNPASALVAALRGRTPAPATTADLKALGSLHQMALEVERDGDALQNLFALYGATGLPRSIEELGVSGDGRTLRLMAVAAAQGSCVASFDTSPGAWRLALQKIWNWGAKNSGRRDTATIAAQVSRSAATQALAPALRATSPRAITVLGHSFTMERHWSSATAFVPLVKAVIESLGAPITITQISAGGLDALWAKSEFLPKALATEAQDIYFIVTTTRAEDQAALAEMIAAVKKSGRRAVVFDAIDFYDPYDHREHVARAAVTAAREAGAEVIEVQQAFDRANAGLRSRYLSLDGVHMTEPYHRFMATEWLRVLAGARGAKDEGAPFSEETLPLETAAAKAQLAADTSGSAWTGVYQEAIAQGREDRAEDIAELYARVLRLPLPGLAGPDAVDDLLEAYGYTALATDAVVSGNGP